MKNKAVLFCALILTACHPFNQSLQAQPGLVETSTTSSGLSYTILKAGSGAAAQPGQEVLIYESMHYPGGQFLFAVERPAAPVRFRIGANQVITGVDDGVRGMRSGEIRRLIVPPAMSRRTEYPEYISPDSTIVYDVELVQILNSSAVLTGSTEMIPATPANNTAGIVFRSKDQGQTWEDVSTGLPGHLQVEYIATKGADVFLGTENGGIYQTTGKQPAWAKIGGSPEFPNEKITGVFPAGDGLYASVFRGGFYVQPAREKTWISMHGTLYDKAIRAVLHTTDAILVGADTGVYKSVDGGKSWKHVFFDGQVTSLVTLGGVLIGGAYNGVVRSIDHGEHWEWVLEDGAAHKTMVIDHQFVVIGMTGGLRASADGGATWQRLDAGLPVKKSAYDLEKVGNYLICSHNDGVFRSPDGGQHWEKLPWKPGGVVLDMAVSEGVIYAGTARR